MIHYIIAATTEHGKVLVYVSQTNTTDLKKVQQHVNEQWNINGDVKLISVKCVPAEEFPYWI